MSQKQQLPSYEELFTEEERKIFRDCFTPIFGPDAKKDTIECAHLIHGVLININTQFALMPAIEFFQKMEAFMLASDPIEFIRMLREQLPGTARTLETAYKNAQMNQQFLNKMLAAYAERQSAKPEEKKPNIVIAKR